MIWHNLSLDKLVSQPGCSKSVYVDTYIPIYSHVYIFMYVFIYLCILCSFAYGSVKVILDMGLSVVKNTLK